MLDQETRALCAAAVDHYRKNEMQISRVIVNPCRFQIFGLDPLAGVPVEYDSKCPEDAFYIVPEVA